MKFALCTIFITNINIADCDKFQWHSGERHRVIMDLFIYVNFYVFFLNKYLFYQKNKAWFTLLPCCVRDKVIRITSRHHVHFWTTNISKYKEVVFFITNEMWYADALEEKHFFEVLGFTNRQRNDFSLRKYKFIL